jgi:hypothetical protein
MGWRFANAVGLIPSSRVLLKALDPLGDGAGEDSGCIEEPKLKLTAIFRWQQAACGCGWYIDTEEDNDEWGECGLWRGS